jgi:hypothetical protein
MLCLNFFTNLFRQAGYGWGDDELKLDYTHLKTISANPDDLIAELNALFFNYGMSDALQGRMRSMISSYSPQDAHWRVKSALILTSLSPEFIIQK